MNNIRGNLLIINDENQILKSLFEKQISNGESHNKGLTTFVNTFYPDNNIVIDENDYNGAPCIIAELGHLVIKTEDSVSLIIFYIPELVTDHQMDWFLENKYNLIKYQMCNGISLQRDENNNRIFTELKGLSSIEENFKIKNEYYRKKKEEDKYVR